MMKQSLYLETQASGMGLRGALLQTRSGTSCPRDKAPDNSILTPTAFASKNLSSAGRRYSNIEREALGILYRLKKSHHFYFAREVSIITDHKPLVAIFKTDVATLSQRLQLILLRITPIQNQNIIQTLCKDWLSTQNHKKNKDTEIPGMQVNINAIQTITNIPDCLTIQELQQATSQDGHQQQIKEHIIKGWPENKN